MSTTEQLVDEIDPATPDTFPTDDEWTIADNLAALREGWNLWDCDGSDDGRTQLCRTDSPDGEDEPDEPLADDDTACRLVLTRANAGSALHLKALQLVEKHNPVEAAAIRQLAGDWPRADNATS